MCRAKGKFGQSGQASSASAAYHDRMHAKHVKQGRLLAVHPERSEWTRCRYSGVGARVANCLTREAFACTPTTGGFVPPVQSMYNASQMGCKFTLVVR